MKLKIRTILFFFNVALFCHHVVLSTQMTERKSFRENIDSTFTEVGRWAYGECKDVAKKNNFLFVGNGQILQVYDASTISSPQLIGELRTKGQVERIALSGNYAYLLNPFQIVDISNPYLPVIISDTLIGLGAREMVISGNYLYIGDFGGYVQIIDITQPEKPKSVGTLVASGEIVMSIVVSEPYCYVSTVDGLTIDVFDISDKVNPTKINMVYVSSAEVILAKEGTFLYANLPSSKEFWILDLTDPKKPTKIGSLSTLTYISSITIQGNIAFVSQVDKISVIDVSDKSNPGMLGEKYPPTLYRSIGKKICDGNYLYVSAKNGAWIIDIQKLDSLKTSSFIQTSSFPSCATVDSSNRVFMGTYYAGLQIIDYANPQSLKLLSTYPTATSVSSVFYTNNLLYLTTRTDFIILDVKNPASPQEVAQMVFSDTLPSNSFTNGVIVQYGKYVYVLRPSKKIFQIDISSKSQPVISDVVSLNADPADMLQYDNYLFVSSTTDGVNIFDTSNDKLIKISKIDSVYAKGLAKSGSTLFVADGVDIKAYNITDPIASVLLTKVKTSTSGAYNVNLWYWRNYILMYHGGAFVIIDVSDLSNPQIKKFVGENNIGPVVVTDKVIIAYGGPKSLVFYTNPILTLVNDEKINVVEPSSYILYQNYPNPFNPSTTVEFSIPQAGNVVLKVFDLLGREVATVVNDFRAEGKYSVEFNGNNLSSGIYFYRLQSGNYIESRKMIFIK